MNAELQGLIEDLLHSEAPGQRLDAGQVVVFRNNAPVPPVQREAGDFWWNRGFDLLILDERGRTTHFAKCRPADDDSFAEASMIRGRLSADPELQTIVPRTRHRRSRQVQVQLSTFVRGRSFGLDGSTISLEDWTTSVHAIITTAERLTARAVRLVPEFAAPPATVMDAAANHSLAYLAAMGLEPERLEALEHAIGPAASLPRRLQHGDLWPANVLHHRGCWWLLDYEMFGRVFLPLYDVFHLVRSSCQQRRPTAGGRASQTWLELLAREGPEPRACQALVREAAARLGLRAEQVLASYALHLADITAKIHGRGNPPKNWEPFLEEVVRLADGLRWGERVPDLLLGGGDGGPAVMTAPAAARR